MVAPDFLFRVLFVCTGNTCRSPLAAAALRRALGDDAHKVEILSAGTAAVEGAPASLAAREAARAHGLDLDEHRSRRLTSELLDGADVVLLMDPKDRDVVRSLSPEAVERTYGLADFGRSDPSGEAVPDPFGGSRQTYVACLRRIEALLESVVSYVRTALREREVWAKPS